MVVEAQVHLRKRRMMMATTTMTLKMKREITLVVKNLQNLSLDPCLPLVIPSLHLDTL
jgi:hypothetical protein